MLENLFCTFTAVFFIIGFVCSVFFLLLRLTRPKNATTVILSFVSPDTENAVAQIGRHLSAMQLACAGTRTVLIAVCEENDTYNKAQLSSFFADESRFFVCDRSQLSDIPAIIRTKRPFFGA